MMEEIINYQGEDDTVNVERKICNPRTLATLKE